MAMKSDTYTLSMKWLSLSFFLFLYAGCAGSVVNMRELPPSQASYLPGENEAIVVFMRPSGIGYGIQSSVFELIAEEPKLVGIVAAKKKLAYRATPGEHLFMVIGENADFMSAVLESGKTYYALIIPRTGLWKARFSLEPVPAKDLTSPDFTTSLVDCNWVETVQASEEWAQTHMASILSKKMHWLPGWKARPQNERPTLHPEDGK